MHMSSLLSVVMQSPLALGELVAELELQGGQKVLVLMQEGRFSGELPAPARRLRLTGHGRDAVDAAYAECGAASELPEPFATTSIEELFEKGIAVPADGRLSLSLTWGVHCHRPVTVAAEPREAPAEGASAQCRAAHRASRAVRFGSFEHITCAEFIGKDDFGRTLRFSNIEASFDKDLFLRVGDKKLTFGEILALAGDYYAHLDEQAAKEFSWAWPEASGLSALIDGDYRKTTMVEDGGEVTTAILNAVNETKDAGQAALDTNANLARLGANTDYPLRRYLALASQNHCHFAAQSATGQVDDGTNEALRLYRAYHGRALKEAEAARQNSDVAAFFQALVADAFGCHFLSDLFATGHMRVPRRVLTERYGVVRGALGMAHDMHCEDNNSGLWLTPRFASRQRVVWRGYGDDMLHKQEAGFHFLLVRRAVARSAAEVFARYCGVVIPEGKRAEDMIPVVLPAGETPRRGDVLPDGTPAPQTNPNTYPLYWWLPDKKVLGRRVGDASQGFYVDHDKPRDGEFLLP
jgi:hypothetical protein